MHEEREQAIIMDEEREQAIMLATIDPESYKKMKNLIASAKPDLEKNHTDSWLIYKMKLRDSSAPSEIVQCFKFL